MKILMFVVIFLLIGAFFMISNENLHLRNSEERDQFFSDYYSWFFKVFDNTKSTTGHVINLDWLP